MTGLPADKPLPPSTRTEFVASWKNWEGAVCVTLEAYEAKERELAEANRTLLIVRGAAQSYKERLEAARPSQRESELLATIPAIERHLAPPSSTAAPVSASEAPKFKEVLEAALLAFAHLGFIRDTMPDADVRVVQGFLDSVKRESAAPKRQNEDWK